MRQFPKYLKVMPTFMGLVPSDLLSIGTALFIGMILGWGTIPTLGLAIIFVGFMKLINRYVDVVGFVLPRKTDLYISKRRP
jgi:hypothetical protein